METIPAAKTRTNLNRAFPIMPFSLIKFSFRPRQDHKPNRISTVRRDRGADPPE